jgi:hypothetical protein
MESLISTIVVLIQLAVAGFVAWGGWLALRDQFRAGGFSGAARSLVYGAGRRGLTG